MHRCSADSSWLATVSTWLYCLFPQIPHWANKLHHFPPGSMKPPMARNNSNKQMDNITDATKLATRSTNYQHSTHELPAGPSPTSSPHAQIRNAARLEARLTAQSSVAAACLAWAQNPREAITGKGNLGIAEQVWGSGGRRPYPL